MKKTSPMFHGFARCLMVAGLTSAVLVGCSDDPVTPGGGAGASSGGSAAGTATGGSATSAGTSSAGTASAGTSSAGTSSAGTASAGTSSAGTSSAGTSSAGTSSGGSSNGGSGGTSTGGSGGTGGGSAGAGGGSAGTGGGAAVTAKATITATTGNTIAGTATFVDTAGIIKLTLAITAGCPAGAHDFHLHEKPLCGADGMDAKAHWVPKGEGLGTLTCAADGTGTATYTTPSAGYWTIGGDAATDLTLHAVMIHAVDPPTARIGCGVPVRQ